MKAVAARQSAWFHRGLSLAICYTSVNEANSISLTAAVGFQSNLVEGSVCVTEEVIKSWVKGQQSKSMKALTEVCAVRVPFYYM